MADMSSLLSTTATATSTIYLSVSGSETGTATSSVSPAATTPAQGSLNSAGAGITGGYTGDSLPLKIIIAFLLGLALYNAIELIVLAFVTFQRYRGLYFWSLVVSAFGIIPYALGFVIKFFRLLDPHENVGYVAVVLLTIGWWAMVSGQSVVLWSRLHLLTNSRRVLRWTLYMIICNGIVLHSITTVLTFGSNSNSLTRSTLQRFVRGYSIMEKTQMVGFFVQETILSIIYIKETIRLLKLSEAVQDDARSFDNTTTNNMGSVGSGGGGVNPHLKQASVRKTMNQLLAINVLIITMDLALLAVEFANLYLIETTLKGVVYSIKLKLEFAVLGKLIQLVRDRAESDHSLNPASAHFANGNKYGGSGGGASNSVGGNTLALEKSASSDHHHHNNGSTNANLASGRLLLNGNPLTHDFVSGQQYPDFVDPRRLSSSVTHAAEHHQQLHVSPGWETRVQVDDGVGGGGGLGPGAERWRRRSRVKRGSWIDEEMDKFNIA